MLHKERTGGSRWVAIVTCVVLGVIFGLWHNRANARGVADPVTGAVRGATTPLVNGANSVGNWFGRQWEWIFGGRRLVDENIRLRRELASTREEVNRLRESDIALQRLRKEMAFPPTPGIKRIAANVTSRRPNSNFETLVIGAGSRSGIKLNDIVVSQNGVIGHVFDVDSSTAAVLMVTDSNASVGAMIQRPDSRASGVCKGNGTGLLSFNYVSPEADVRVGDIVVSSGLGGAKGVYPKGLVIGTVSAVTPDRTGATRKIYVQPSVNLNRTEEVFVLI